MITYYTSGVPLTMQYIGDSLFWMIEQNNITLKDTKEAIILASHEIRNKQLRVLNKIKFDIYEDILIRIAENKYEIFEVSDLKKILSEKEQDYLNEFLKEMINIHILNKNTDNEKYEFIDKLDYSYYFIKSFEKRYNQIPIN